MARTSGESLTCRQRAGLYRGARSHRIAQIATCLVAGVAPGLWRKSAERSGFAPFEGVRLRASFELPMPSYDGDQSKLDSEHPLSDINEPLCPDGAGDGRPLSLKASRSPKR